MFEIGGYSLANETDRGTWHATITGASDLHFATIHSEAANQL